jgi:hypothetical protein
MYCISGSRTWPTLKTTGALADVIVPRSCARPNTGQALSTARKLVSFVFASTPFCSDDLVMVGYFRSTTNLDELCANYSILTGLIRRADGIRCTVIGGPLLDMVVDLVEVGLRRELNLVCDCP